ncbi:hypothetical protein LDT96_004660 [Salmonella enterica]|nr:hypothetical protein [Salmonella enterica]EIE5840257.1 hypothetical protein [Salmonella enterica]
MGKISSGKTLLMSMRAHAIAPAPNVRGYFSSGDPDHVLAYLISYPNLPEISSGNISSFLMNLDNTHPLTIKPNSDTYLMASYIQQLSLGKNPSNLGSTVSGGFDYAFTYQ